MKIVHNQVLERGLFWLKSKWSIHSHNSHNYKTLSLFSFSILFICQSHPVSLCWNWEMLTYLHGYVNSLSKCCSLQTWVPKPCKLSFPSERRSVEDQNAGKASWWRWCLTQYLKDRSSLFGANERLLFVFLRETVERNQLKDGVLKDLLNVIACRSLSSFLSL